MESSHLKKNALKNKKKEKYDDDDGRVYADMSILDDLDSGLALRPRSRKKRSYDSDGNLLEYASLELTKKEKREIAWGVIKAHLLYALMGIALLVILFLFLIKFWLA